MIEKRVRLWKPHTGQQKVLDSAKRFNVLRCGRRFGKSMLGLNLIAETAIKGHPAGWFAPTYKYLSEAWRIGSKILEPIASRTSVTEHRIELLTRGSVEFWTLENQDAGRSRAYKRVVVDEAGHARNLEEAWTGSIRPTLTDLKGDAWFFGTPHGRGYFHQLWVKGQQAEPDWQSWQLHTTDNPYIDRDEVASAKRDLPDQAYRQEYEGEPADDSGNPFGVASIQSCVCELSSGKPVAFGVDLAKSQDWTVVCGLDADGHVCSLERWQSDWGQTRRRVLDLIGTSRTLIDSTGVGDPIVEDLQRERPSIEGFKFSSQSKQQIMEGLASSIQRQVIGFPDGWLVNELESFEYAYTKTGVHYEAPSGLHDDGVCALALAVHHRQQASRYNLDVRVITSERSTTMRQPIKTDAAPRQPVFVGGDE